LWVQLTTDKTEAPDQPHDDFHKHFNCNPPSCYLS